MSPLNILFLCNRPTTNADASTVTDHIDSFRLYSRHHIFQLSFLRKLPSRLNLDRFDIIVIHYSIALGYFSDQFIDIGSKKKIGASCPLKVVFVQDEYRNVNATINAIKMMNTDLLFTCVPEEEIIKVYPDEVLPETKKINNLTGYVPKRLLGLDAPPIKSRPIDVGYRSRRVPYWFGDLGYEKWNIAESFIKYTKQFDLNLDISNKESDRIYGKNWIRFNCACKAVLGAESGANVFDFTGEISKTVDRYQEKHPGATYHEIHKLFLEEHDGKIRLNQISPRFFEAAALKTVMILYEGNYSGILKPWRHFIPLKKDYSNISEVVTALKDDKKLQEIADRTYREIALNEKYSYQNFIQRFDQIVEDELVQRNKQHVFVPYDRLEFSRSLALSPNYLFYRGISRFMQRFVLGTKLRRIIYHVWTKMPLNFKGAVRPLLWIIGR